MKDVTVTEWVSKLIASSTWILSFTSGVALA